MYGRHTWAFRLPGPRINSDPYGPATASPSPSGTSIKSSMASPISPRTSPFDSPTATHPAKSGACAQKHFAPLNDEGVRHRPTHFRPACLRTLFHAPSHPDSSLECVRAIIHLWLGNRRPNPVRRCRIRLIDCETLMVYAAAAGHPVWAECSHVLVVDSC